MGSGVSKSFNLLSLPKEVTSVFLLLFANLRDYFCLSEIAISVTCWDFDLDFRAFGCEFIFCFINL